MKKKYYFVAVLVSSALLIIGLRVGYFDGINSDTKNSEETPAEQIEEVVSEKDYYNPKLDYLVLVDSAHPLPEGWEESIEIEHFTNLLDNDVKIERTAYEAYLKMKASLEKDGVYVDLDSAYRSIEEQQKIIDDFTQKYGVSYANTYAAAPGYSEHHTGLALDLFLVVDGKIVYENEDLMKYPEIWEKIHSRLAEYGFILRYPGYGGYAYEPWHIRYVGIDAAKTIRDRDCTFEEYLQTTWNNK